MVAGKDDLDQLGREIRKIIQENKKFLDRVMDEEFEPEDGDDGETEITEEL